MAAARGAGLLSLCAMRRQLMAASMVLAMLGAGFKDEAIARHLGISMRTTGRRVLSILDHLQASTRFQAGAQAVRRGWL